MRTTWFENNILLGEKKADWGYYMSILWRSKEVCKMKYLSCQWSDRCGRGELHSPETCSEISYSEIYLDEKRACRPVNPENMPWDLLCRSLWKVFETASPGMVDLASYLQNKLFPFLTIVCSFIGAIMLLPPLVEMCDIKLRREFGYEVETHLKWVRRKLLSCRSLVRQQDEAGRNTRR